MYLPARDRFSPTSGRQSKFLYSAASSPAQMHYNLFNRIQSLPVKQAVSHATITTRRPIFTNIRNSITSYSFVQLGERVRRKVNQHAQSSRTRILPTASITAPLRSINRLSSRSRNHEQRDVLFYLDNKG